MGSRSRTVRQGADRGWAAAPRLARRDCGLPVLPACSCLTPRMEGMEGAGAASASGWIRAEPPARQVAFLRQQPRGDGADARPPAPALLQEAGDVLLHERLAPTLPKHARLGRRHITAPRSRSRTSGCAAAAAAVLQRATVGVLGGSGPVSVALATWFRPAVRSPTRLQRAALGPKTGPTPDCLGGWIRLAPSSVDEVSRLASTARETLPKPENTFSQPNTPPNSLPG